MSVLQNVANLLSLLYDNIDQDIPISADMTALGLGQTPMEPKEECMEEDGEKVLSDTSGGVVVSRQTTFNAVQESLVNVSGVKLEGPFNQLDVVDTKNVRLTCQNCSKVSENVQMTFSYSQVC